MHALLLSFVWIYKKKNTLQLKGFGTELSGRVQNLYAMVCVQGHGPVARIPTMAVLR